LPGSWVFHSLEEEERFGNLRVGTPRNWVGRIGLEELGWEEFFLTFQGGWNYDIRKITGLFLGILEGEEKPLY